MKVCNVTGWDREATADGRTYYFKPFETKEIFSDHAFLICRNYVDSGLVPLEYAAPGNEHYATEEDYLRDKKLFGLNEVYKALLKYKTYETQAKNDMQMSSKSSEFDKRMVDPSKFDKQIEEIETLIDQLKNKGKNTKSEKTEEVKVVSSKRGKAEAILDELR